MFNAYTYKLLRSPMLYVGILGVFALCCTNFIRDDFNYRTVLYHMQNFLDIGMYRKVLAVFGALPFTANFAEEWITGITKQCIVRSGVKKYAAANLLLCWFSSMLTVFLGMTFFMGFYSLFVPISEPYVNPYNFLFGQFLHNGHGEIFLLLRTLVFSASCAMWAVMGMLLSVFMPNKFVAICTPLVASYVIERITMQLPGDLNFWYISLSFVYHDTFGSDLLGFLYCVGFFAVIAAVCGMIFYVFLKRKVQNEIA